MMLLHCKASRSIDGESDRNVSLLENRVLPEFKVMQVFIIKDIECM